MHSIIFLAPRDTDRALLGHTLAQLRCHPGIELLETVDQLEHRLRTQDPSSQLVVLSILNNTIMTGLLGLSELLENLPIVAIVPDGDSELLHGAHRLRPRYVHTPSDPPQHLTSVIGNLI